MKQRNNQINRKVIPYFVFNNDKSPPSAVDFEEAILGSIMLEAQADHVKRILPKVRTDHFYKESHQLVFKAIKDLYEQDFPVDILTVTEQCRKNGDLESVGGAYAITMLTSRISSTANIDYWFHIVYQKFLLREIIRIGILNADMAMKDSADVFDLLSEFIAELEKLDPTLFETLATTADRLAVEMMEELDFIQVHKSKKLSLPQMVIL